MSERCFLLTRETLSFASSGEKEISGLFYDYKIRVRDVGVF